MKKIIAGLSALAIMAMPVTAFADTTVNPKGGDPFDVTPDPGSANTTVKFSVDPAYTVTIPQKIELAKDTDGLYKGADSIKAASVFLEPDQRIVVTLTSPGGFKLSNGADNTVKLAYNATGSEGVVDADHNGRRVAEFATSKVEQSVDISFATTEKPEYAGKYSDTVVFGISVAELS